MGVETHVVCLLAVHVHGKEACACPHASPSRQHCAFDHASWVAQRQRSPAPMLLQGKEGVHLRRSKFSSCWPCVPPHPTMHAIHDTSSEPPPSDPPQGKEGVHLRRSKFELIEDGFVQNSGLKELSYQASGWTAITGGRVGGAGFSRSRQRRLFT